MNEKRIQQVLDLEKQAREIYEASVSEAAQIPVAAEKDVQALIKEYNEAENRYYKPLQDAKSDEERMKIKLDMKKHPARSFLPKFQAIASNAQGTPAEKQALVCSCSPISRSGIPTRTTSYARRRACSPMS